MIKGPQCADELDISLALVDGMLDRGPCHGIDPKRWQRTLLLQRPFPDIWDPGNDHAFLVGLDPSDVDGTRFSMIGGPEEEGADTYYALSRLDVIGPKQTRRAGLPVLSRDVVRDRAVFVDQQGLPHGRLGGYEIICQRVEKMRWAVAHSNVNRLPEVDVEWSGRIQMMMAIMWEMQFQWSVEFIGSSGMSFMMPCTSAGAREMFRERDRKAGNSRRTALRHWVREHMRVSRKGNVHSVAGHLRSEEPFAWRGYSCRLTPSLVDVERSGKKSLST